MAYLCAMEHPLPETNMTSALKMDGGFIRNSFPFGSFRPIFRVRNVRFRECFPRFVSVRGIPSRPPNLQQKATADVDDKFDPRGWVVGSEISVFLGSPQKFTDFLYGESFVISHIRFPRYFHVFFGSTLNCSDPICRFISPLANLNKNMLSICRIDAQVTIRKTDMELVEDHCNLLIWRISHFP